MLLIDLSQTGGNDITKTSRYNIFEGCLNDASYTPCVSFSYFDFIHGNTVTPLVLIFRWTAARWTASGRIAQPWMTDAAAQIKTGREIPNKSALARWWIRVWSKRRCMICSKPVASRGHASARINKRGTIQIDLRQLIDRRCYSTLRHRQDIDSSSRHDLRIDTSTHRHSTKSNLFLPTPYTELGSGSV